MKFLKSIALVLAVAAAVAVLMGAANGLSCRPRPDAGLPVRPERFKPAELGPTVEQAIQAIERRLPADQRSPRDVLEPADK